MHNSSAHVSGSPAAPSIIRTRASMLWGMKPVVVMLRPAMRFSQRAVPGAYSTVQAQPSFALKMLMRRPSASSHIRSVPDVVRMSPAGWFMRISRAFLYHMPPMPQSAAIQPKLPLVMMFCQQRPGRPVKPNAMSFRNVSGTASGTRGALSSGAGRGVRSGFACPIITAARDDIVPSASSGAKCTPPRAPMSASSEYSASSRSMRRSSGC